jgi:hypothetical protein
VISETNLHKKYILVNHFNTTPMKTKLSIFFLLFAATMLQGQRLDRLPPASEIPREYRSEFRANLREYHRRADLLRQNGYDIVLDDLEQVPTFATFATTAAQTNWGEQMLLPPALRDRVKAECTHPVVIKVTDTGGKLTHSALVKGQLPGSSYTGESDPEDGNGHALHVAGIIGADAFGLAFPLIEKGLLKFKPVKILGNAGGGSFSWVSTCYATERPEDLNYIKAKTAVIYSGSFGGGTALIAPVEAELKKSTEAGVFFAFAAGNTGGPVNYPGNSPYAITCASLDQSMAVSSFSSRGPEVDNAKPGRSINSTYKAGGYATLSGTSMATPFLSAAMAIAISKWGLDYFPTTDAMKAYLAKVSTDLSPPGRDDPSGWGVAFIVSILNTKPDGGTPPPPPPPPPPVEPEKVLATTVLNNVAMRYSFAGESTLRNLNIVSLELYGAGETTEKALQAIRETADRFFASSYIAEIPKAGKGVESGLQGAAYWTVTFLNYTGRPIGLRGVRIVAKGEAATDAPFILENIFDRAIDDLPSSYEQGSPQIRRY